MHQTQTTSRINGPHHLVRGFKKVPSPRQANHTETAAALEVLDPAGLPGRLAVTAKRQNPVLREQEESPPPFLEVSHLLGRPTHARAQGLEEGLTSAAASAAAAEVGAAGAAKLEVSAPPTSM